jgi:hypothetical protein
VVSEGPYESFGRHTGVGFLANSGSGGVLFHVKLFLLDHNV